jgi:hypothetical protein
MGVGVGVRAGGEELALRPPPLERRRRRLRGAGHGVEDRRIPGGESAHGGVGAHGRGEPVPLLAVDPLHTKWIGAAYKSNGSTAAKNGDDDDDDDDGPFPWICG